MVTLPVPRAVKPLVAPLSNADVVRAERAASRLVASLRQVVSALPERERGPAALARRLDINRNTCQRITATLLEHRVSAETLVRLPGATGLRQFSAALDQIDVDEEARAGLRAAIDAADEVTRELAGSQSELARRLAADEATGDVAANAEGADLETRKRMFECGVQLTGRSSESRLWLNIYNPVGGDPYNDHELVEVLGLTGHRWTASSLPLVFGSSEGRDGTKNRRETLDGSPLSGDTSTALLPGFCSRPLPRLTARLTPRFVIQTVDFDGPAPERGADVVFADHSVQTPPPLGRDPAIAEIWTFQLTAVRRLIFDVYLHRTTAALCTVAASVQLWEPNYQDLASQRWLSRLPSGPTLRVLEEGIASAETDAYARYGELTAHVFEQRGWDIHDFVGYRCDVAYPLWRAGYLMSFDFSDR